MFVTCLCGGKGFHIADDLRFGRFFAHIKLSHEQNLYYFPLYWLVNKDPYNGLL